MASANRAMVTPGVRIVCTGRGSHPSREVAPPLHLWNDPELRDALLADDGLPEHEAEALYRWDRICFFPSEREARRGGQVQIAKVERGFTQLGEGEVGDPGDGRGGLWRFRCPTCRRDVPLRSDTLAKVLETVRTAGMVRVDISAIRFLLS